MKYHLFYLVIVLTFSFGCSDLGILERDENNFFFHRNIINNVNINENGVLKVVTFNMHMGFCKDCDPFSNEIGGDKKQLDSIISFLNSLNADIISLQEVAFDYKTSIIQDQIKYIATGIGFNYAFGVNMNIQNKGIMGNAILSRYEILDSENPLIRYVDFNSQNHCLKVNLRLNEGLIISVLNAHLVARGTTDEKQLQIDRIIEETEVNKPILMTGDFNIPYEFDMFFDPFINRGFVNSIDQIPLSQRRDIFDTGTFLSGSVIDYIFVSDEFVIRSGITEPSMFNEISDHLAYIINLEY